MPYVNVLLAQTADNSSVVHVNAQPALTAKLMDLTVNAHNVKQDIHQSLANVNYVLLLPIVKPMGQVVTVSIVFLDINYKLMDNVLAQLLIIVKLWVLIADAKPVKLVINFKMED